MRLTPEAITEVSTAFADIAGQENAERLLKLLEGILQQQNSSSAPAEPAAAGEPAQQEPLPPQQQQQTEWEIDLLPVDDKESRKVGSIRPIPVNIQSFQDLTHAISKQ